MGGVYLLGIAPGTVVRGNHIHDVECQNYGGWGIYLDEGSSHVVIEGNVVHDTSSQCYHQHYGREVIVRDNIWARGREGNIAISRPEDHTSFTFLSNFVVGTSTSGFVSNSGARSVRNYSIDNDLNLFWDDAPVAGAVRTVSADRPKCADGFDGLEIMEALD